jgi:hypothetical protein
MINASRLRNSFTKKATQKTAAMLAVIMKLRGDTSNDVSATIRPKAMPEKNHCELEQPDWTGQPALGRDSVFNS